MAKAVRDFSGRPTHLATFEGDDTMRRQSALRLYDGFRSAELVLLRRIIERTAVGSSTWYLLQDVLSRRSAVGMDLATRSWFIARSTRSSGADLCVFPGAILHYPSNIVFGSRVFLNRGAMITAPTTVSVGNDTLLGPGVIINSGNHGIADPDATIRSQGHETRPISIGDDVWLGARSCVLAGVTIGNGAVVGAGAVVTRDVAPHAVVGGIPARSITTRRSDGREGHPEI